MVDGKCIVFRHIKEYGLVEIPSVNGATDRFGHIIPFRGVRRSLDEIVVRIMHQLVLQTLLGQHGQRGGCSSPVVRIGPGPLGFRVIIGLVVPVCTDCDSVVAISQGLGGQDQGEQKKGQ